MAERRKGPVVLIGAADLAVETLDPDELAAFLSFSLDDLFIKSPADLKAALAEKPRRAWDGLYPVMDYYCADNSWQPTVQTLMRDADRVVLERPLLGVLIGLACIQCTLHAACLVFV